MAPHAEESVVVSYSPQKIISKHTLNPFNVGRQSLPDCYEPGRTQVTAYEPYEFEHLSPRFPLFKWDPLEEIPYSDRGLQGDPKFRNLLEAADDVFDYTPKIGTEITGVNLAGLTDSQKCDLARLIATRGVVFFRDQDDFDIQAQRELGTFYGSLHKHATTAMPKQEGLEDVHVVWNTENSVDQRAVYSPTFLWHSDVTYEVQPPSYTSLKVLTGPPRGGGGDTHWCSQYAIYDVLSAPMQKYLESLTALHSAEMQAEDSRKAGRPPRREPITTEHPLIRVNPVTGWKSVFFNPGFVTKIIGIPKAESDAIIAYLSQLIATTQEAHVRFQWGKNDVALWDNRSTNHTASYGFAPHRRHGVRVASRAEKPFFTTAGRSQEEEFNQKWGLPQISKNGAGVSNYND